ncbi:MAG TPA: hypothetical protein VF515_14190 [Candidatus Binatia bacterium]|jgi:uncharacterized protein HemX
MARWVVIIGAVAVAAAVGFLAGYVHWASQVTQLQQLQRRAQSSDSEEAALRSEKQQLEERIDQITKEQERLAQENETLRKERTKQQLLMGQEGELPARPPK